MYRENKEVPVTETKAHPCLTRWRRRIDWAEQHGGFHADHKQAVWRWDMCAIGEAHKLYGIEVEDDIVWQPKDHNLYHLGKCFASAVDADDLVRCRRLIALIEQRLAELAR